MRNHGLLQAGSRESRGRGDCSSSSSVVTDFQAPSPPPLLPSSSPADYQPWVEVLGIMLELYETTIRYPGLPNVDFTMMFGDEMMNIAPTRSLLPILLLYKGDKHESGILVPNGGYYR